MHLDILLFVDDLLEFMLPFANSSYFVWIHFSILPDDLANWSYKGKQLGEMTAVT